jgi:DNA polymerase-3 subunit gamma/tau
VNEYMVTARKWRPMRFEDVVGQAHVTTTLRNAVRTGRLAHAYLFSGPRGVGKTTTARLLAKVVNCLHPLDANPDNECDICREITEGRSFDVLEIDGASNRGVEEIRNLREAVRYAPSKGQYRVYIIDEVHMLTKEAFNALLKTLEEPPAHVLFIFATTEIHKVPPTILSRCQRFDFRRIGIEEIVANLKVIAAAEKLQIDDDALLLVAKRGDGSLRDAQSTFDQVVSLCGHAVTYAEILRALHIVDQEIYFRVTDLVTSRDTRGALALVEELFQQGYDVREFLAGLLEHFRNIMIARETGSTGLIEASDMYRKRYADAAREFSIADLLRYQRFIGSTESAVRWSSQPRFKLEADLVQLVSMQKAPEVGEILARLDELKKKSADGPAEPRFHPATVTRAGSAKAAEPSVPEDPAFPPAALQKSISEEEVNSRWDEYLGEVRRTRISLGSLLESTRCIGVRGTVVRIGCVNDFQVSSISRNREILSGIFRAVFHVNVRLEPVLDESRPAASEGEAGASAQAVTGEHPVVTALRRELGAEPL